MWTDGELIGRAVSIIKAFSLFACVLTDARCSLGDPPYNHGTAFGQNNVSMPAPLPSTAGALTVQDQMFIQITAMM